MENNLIEIFKTLVKIPSPSLKEYKAADKIVEILQSNNICVKKDAYGNVKAVIKATDLSKKSIILSAHMDVVGDDSPIQLIENAPYIETDKTRTLGADDKAGVAAAIMLAIDIQKSDILHGGLELVFTKDEEQSMSGVHHINYKELNSKYILVLDSDRLGRVEVSGAGYTKLVLKVTAPKGGHSGLDIDDDTRVNAVKLIGELINKIPQGVYKRDKKGVIASINIGSVIGGAVQNAVVNAVKNDVKTADIIHYVADNSMSNIINTDAEALYSLRSSDKKVEDCLMNEIHKIIEDFNKKYFDKAKAHLIIEEHLPIFEEPDDTTLTEISRRASLKAGVDVQISSFHAGAETHIYAHNKNSKGEYFIPVLLGVANIYNMHSSDEKIDIESYKKGYLFLKAFFEEFNK